MNDEYTTMTTSVPEELLARIVAKMRELSANDNILTPLHPSAFLQAVRCR